MGCHAAYAGSAEIVALGNGIHEYDVLVQVRNIHCREVRFVGVAELAIDLVTDEEEVVAAAEVSQLEHFLAGEELARRIARVADEHGLGPVADQFLELLYRRHLEAVAYVGVHGLEHYAVELREGVVIGVIRLYDYDFVACVRRNLHRHGEGLAAGHVYDDLGEVQFYAYLAVVFLYHSLAELGETEGVGIGEMVYLPALAGHCLKGALRGLDVRSSHVEMIDLDAICLRSVCEGNELPDCGSGH